jgi:hypothetical protein
LERFRTRTSEVSVTGIATKSVLTLTRFSVGTGKPSVFATEILSQFTNSIKEAGECSPHDKASAIELELYADLYQCVVQQAVHIGKTKSEFHAWKCKHENCMNPLSDKQTTFH